MDESPRDPLLEALGELPAIVPPRRVDRAVRRCIRVDAAARRWRLRPLPAALLAVGGLLGGQQLLSGVLVGWLGRPAPLASMVLITGYLSVCAAATVPLLIRERKRPEAPHGNEVKR